MDAKIPTFELSEGVKIPAVGYGCAFGNWTDSNSFIGFTPEQGWKSVPMALEAGYKHFDCAVCYGSHRQVGASLGAAFASGKIASREDVFITTKVFHDTAPIVLANVDNGVDMSNPKWLKEQGSLKARIHKDFENSLSDLGVGYVDLLLMHWPGSPANTKEVNKFMRQEVWAAMEEIHAKGWARALGLSNFTPEHTQEILQSGTVKPVLNQIEVSPYYYRADLIQWFQHEERGIRVEAWAPFGSGGTGLLRDETLVAIGKTHSKDVGQVILRWLHQHGIVSLPKSSSPSRLASNLNIFDFVLSAEEMTAINGLNKGLSSVPSNPIEAIP